LTGSSRLSSVGARFPRERVALAADTKAWAGKRNDRLRQQRRKSRSLLEVARDSPASRLILETLPRGDE